MLINLLVWYSKLNQYTNYIRSKIEYFKESSDTEPICKKKILDEYQSMSNKINSNITRIVKIRTIEKALVNNEPLYRYQSLLDELKIEIVNKTN